MAVLSLPKSGNDYYSDESVTFSSQGSFDPDDDSITFEWTSSIDGEVLSTELFIAEVFLSEGMHTITLKVTDTIGAYDTAEVRITVVLPATSFSEDDALINHIGFLLTLCVISMVALVWKRS